MEQAMPQSWSPLISKDDRKEALDFGHSFGSKKVGMSAALVNLRFMCHCLARAVKMHLDFNPKDKYFLHDFADDEELRFTYNFRKDLRVTINPRSKDSSDPFVQVVE